MKNIGKTIRIIRELAGIRQGELAKRVQVSANYISLVENQKREPSLRFLKKVADELDLPMSVFFWEEIDTSAGASEVVIRSASNINSLFWETIKSRLNGRGRSNAQG